MEIVGGARSRLLWVVRHGESTWEPAQRSQRGISHPPLTARGMTQAYAAGYALQDKGISRIVCSDAVRARQTAKAMSTVLGVEACIDERLREPRSQPTGTLADARAYRPAVLEDATERIRTVLLEVAAMDGTTAVVTHGDVVCAILDLLRARDAVTSQWRTGTDVPNGSITRVNLRRVSRLVR
ncbi:histidine phosphatase family protein [Mycobacterium sp. NPDC006124]|uniref:histidine phosphatase family protein n=1 Tax=Mycobacterium sp. NPDC006124 TaxID=3156729 RepID=UPI0033AD2656